MNIPVYLSHATPHTKKHEMLLEKMMGICAERGLECVAIKSCDIRTNDSVSAIKEKMKNCYGLVAFACERRLLKDAVNKNGADLPGLSESRIEEKKETTPYIQIETAIALAYDLPVAVFKEKDLIEEGVLEPYCAGITGPSFDIDDESFFESKQFEEAMDAFALEVKQTYVGRHTFVS